MHLAREPRQHSPHVACLGTKEGLIVNALLPKDASFKIGNYEIKENERVRSTNVNGGLLDIGGDKIETFILLLMPVAVGVVRKIMT